MRSRYSAYAVGDLNYVFRTWHPRTRPDDVLPSTGVTWRGLEIIDAVDGGPEDDEGVVEFIAHFETDAGQDALHERSRFARRANRWMYLDGQISAG